MVDEARASLLEQAEAWIQGLPQPPRLVAAYGSVLGQSFDPTRSDLNLLVVVEASVVAMLADAVQMARARRLSVMVLTPTELERLPELFPVKVHAIQRHYQVLRGDDTLASLTPTSEALVRQCRSDLQNVAMKVRRTLLQGAPSPQALQEGIRRFLPQVRDVFRVLHEQGGGSPLATMAEVLQDMAVRCGFDPAVWSECERLRGSEVPAWPEALETTLHLMEGLEGLLRHLE